MPKLDKLLCHYNLTSFPVVKIGSIIDYEQPGKYIVQSTRYDDTYPTPVLTAGQTFVLGYTDDKSGIYAASKDNPVIIFDDFTGAFKWVAFPFKVKSSAMKLLTAKENAISLRYFFHMMGHINFTSDEHKRLWIATYSNFSIPLPPLEVQQEIVRILDQFTQLTAELTAELIARKKQYEYYRDALFVFEDEVRQRPLEAEFPSIRNGFVGTITSFFSDEKNGVRYLEGRDIHEGIISDEKAVYVTKEFHNKHLKTQLKPNDIVMVQSGHVGECAVVGDKYAGANCHALIVMSNGGNCDSKYVTYYLQSSEGKSKLASITTGGTVKHILASKIKKVTVPFPPIEEQRRIVAILDRFDTLCNDLTSGLPAEIAARQKQYEYYRDKLLTFPQRKEADA